MRVAIVDSGVHVGHPHVGDVSDGVAIREDGTLDANYVDRLGHGTAVAAAIREKAPAAEIIAIKIFWRSLTANATTLVRALDEARARHADVVNLSLGTTDDRRRADLAAAIERASHDGMHVVSAEEDAGVRWLPGDLDGVIPVRLDWQCARETYRIVPVRGRSIVVASGYPRDIPGVPRERNLKGISFAVANASAFVARAREAQPGASAPEILECLRRGAQGGTT